jgi:hypothetical protein
MMLLSRISAPGFITDAMLRRIVCAARFGWFCTIILTRNTEASDEAGGWGRKKL